MVEIAAVVLTIGAILYQNLHLGLLMIILIGVVITIIFSFTLQSLRGVMFSFMIGLVFVCGALAVWSANTAISPNVFGNRAFDAKVMSVDRRLSQTNLVVRDVEHNARIQVFIYEKATYLPGDIVTVQASIEEPQSFLTDNGRIFDYPKYLESKGIIAVAKNAKVRVEERGSMTLLRLATIARFRIADILSNNIPFPIDGIVAGMTVGYQGGLPKDIQNTFRDTGVLHVLVLSGYNITLLAMFLAFLLRQLPFRLRTILTIVSIILLVVVSGSGTAAIRAGIMGSIALFAGLSIRSYKPFRALVIAYLVFFFISPLSIFSDPGFHLSFLATAFMILVLSRAEKLFSFIPKTKRFDMRELFILAFLIPLFMLPYMMYFSGNFPLVSPLANILFSLVTLPLMLGGVGVLVLSWIPPVVHICGAIVGAIGELVLHILDLFSKFPVWHTPQLPWWSVTGFYSILLLLLFRKEIKTYLWHLRNVLQQQPSSHS